jgi:hypothetical protein
MLFGVPRGSVILEKLREIEERFSHENEIDRLPSIPALARILNE